MNLLEEFISQLNIIFVGDTDIDYKEDNSEMNAIDGEEGDFGTIRYYSIDGDLLATRIIHGGDDEETIFTKKGEKELAKAVFNLVTDRILDTLFY